MPVHNCGKLFLRFFLTESMTNIRAMKRSVIRSTRDGDIHSAMKVFRQLLDSSDQLHVPNDVLSNLLHLIQVTKESSYLEEIVAKAKSNIPDSQLSSTLINCLVEFNKLAEACHEFQSMKQQGLHLRSGAIHSMLSALVAKGQLSLVPQLLTDLVEKQQTLKPMLAKELLDTSLKSNDRTVFESILSIYELHDEPVQEVVVESLLNWFKRESGTNLQVKFASISASGLCSNCGKDLTTTLGTDQYQQLLEYSQKKLEIEAASIVNSESILERFYLLLREKRPFNAVIDCENMSYINGHFNINKLRRVCRFLKPGGNSLLLVGRNRIGKSLCHAERFRSITELKRHYAYQNMHMFLTPSNWADDFYILFASIFSGPDTMLVSNDTMGDHTSKMPQHIQRIFSQWRRSRQVYFDPDQRQLKFPQQVATQIMKGRDCWHIPVRDKDAYYWLCIK